jgi:hypothetical protein
MSRQKRPGHSWRRCVRASGPRPDRPRSLCTVLPPCPHHRTPPMPAQRRRRGADPAPAARAPPPCGTSPSTSSWCTRRSEEEQSPCQKRGTTRARTIVPADCLRHPSLKDKKGKSEVRVSDWGGHPRTLAHWALADPIAWRARMAQMPLWFYKGKKQEVDARGMSHV